MLFMKHPKKLPVGEIYQKTRLLQVGSSIYVRVPKEFINSHNLEPKDIVVVRATNNEITIIPEKDFEGGGG